MLTKADQDVVRRIIREEAEKAVAEHEYRFDHFIHPEFVQAHLLTNPKTNPLLRQSEDEKFRLLDRKERLVEELKLLSHELRERLQLLGEDV